ncbi:MAG: LuxR family two component transcriptional regulator [Frankiales bacterium]|nr:LuxR family two component transcriptional regulator [Frankiales bacterium]
MLGSNSRFSKYVFVVASPMLCWGFDNVLQTCFPRIRMCGSAPSLDVALDKLRSVPVDLLVVDADEGYDVEALSQAAQQFNLVLLTSSRSSPHVKDIVPGIAAILRKDDAPTSIIAGLEKAAEQSTHGHQRFSAKEDAAALLGTSAAKRIASLTMRERQLIFALVCYSTAAGKVIASRLCISEHTLRNHLSSFYG